MKYCILQQQLTQTTRRCSSVKNLQLCKVRSDSQFWGLDVPGSSLNCVAVITGKLGDYLQKGGAVVFYWLAIAVEPCLVLGTQHSHSGFEVWQAVPDVVHEQSAESFGQITWAGPRGEWGVVALQKCLLIPQWVLEALLGIDVMLTPRRNTN